MGASASSLLGVSIKDLPAVHVACIHLEMDVAVGSYNRQISNTFGVVKGWAMRPGYYLQSALTIGIPQVVDQRLVGYDCCVEVPETVLEGTEEVAIKDVPGGRYAVLRSGKDSRAIKMVIEQFYAEYVPEHHLALDVSRPTYEVYGMRTMEYCVPVR